MTSQWFWVAAFGNAPAGAVLLVAGLSKIAAPGQLRVALGELLGSFAFVTVGFVRALAAIELAVAIALLVNSTRLVGGILAAAVGVGFAAAGLTGALRHTHNGCGCFGSTSDRTFGLVNILVGGALVALGPLNQAMSVTSDGPAAYTRTALLATAAWALVLVVWLNRRLLRSQLHGKLAVGRATA